MPFGVVRSAISLQRLTELCERFYQRDGFVKWADVGNALGVSRQAVQLRLRAAVEKGQISPETVERWQSMSSRRATTRERAATRRTEDNRLRRSILFTPENYAWLQEEAAFRKMTIPDIINGMVNISREHKK